MYHPEVVGRRAAALVDELRRSVDPTLSPSARSIAETLDRASQLPDMTEKGLSRPLRAHEQRFILEELTRARVDARYWLERYALIKTKSQALAPLRLLESQDIAFDHLAETERLVFTGERYDGLLFIILKARQLGMSTLFEALLVHRVIFTPFTTAMVASDEEPNAAHLFDMAERIYDNLPWWMRPMKTFHVKNKEMVFGDIDSEFICRWGRSMGGGKQTGQSMGRGQIGRGWTIPLFHISELATWENPQQLDESFFATVPVSNASFGALESTGRGRHNWWHQRWETSVKGLGRFVPIFIPWFAETHTYRRPAPPGWQPLPETLHHAEAAKAISHRWCRRTMTLDRDQLFWWESEKRDYEERGVLAKFLAEYCADPMDAFQAMDGCLFGADLLHRLTQAAPQKPLAYDLV